MDSILVLRTTFLLASACILAVKAVPSLSSRFLAYGSREHGQLHVQQSQVMAGIINPIAAIRVPHSWFASFYVASTSCSLLWASQILLNGSLYRAIATNSGSQDAKSSMTLDQVTVTWLLMFLQGLRRLYECLAFSRPSSSRMWIGHWAFGMWYYLSVNIAVWIEGSATLLNASHQLHHVSFRPPTLRTFVGTLVFLLASGVQHDCHAYLASLKKYSVPAHPVFRSIICPHYLAECFIYLAMSLVAAPPGLLFNRTILCACFLVVVNLGVTADGTKRWYESKFGVETVRGRWRMIPYVF